MTDKNLFDFANLDDLPEELASPLQTETRDNAVQYAQIVKDGAAAGFDSLNIRQITAVAFRKFGKVPTQATVRAYLNEAVKLKLIGKPTRASYSADTSVVTEGDEEDQEVAAQDAVEADPLADLT